MKQTNAENLCLSKPVIYHSYQINFRQPIKCGQSVRLTHLQTGRNLHSHHFQSPLSHNLEVSAFGEDGEGDEGRNFATFCTVLF